MGNAELKGHFRKQDSCATPYGHCYFLMTCKIKRKKDKAKIKNNIRRRFISILYNFNSLRCGVASTNMGCELDL